MNSFCESAGKMYTAFEACLAECVLPEEPALLMELRGRPVTSTFSSSEAEAALQTVGGPIWLALF